MFPRNAAAAIALSVFALATTVAHAELPRVIVASSPDVDAKPGLVEAVAIQLSGMARVEEGPELPGATPGARTEAASDLAFEEGAALVVWVDVQEEDAAGRVLHAVGIVGGGEPERLAVAAVPNGDGPEVERALALMVREALDQRERYEAERRAAEEAAEREPPEPEPPPQPSRAPRQAAPWMELGAGVTASGGNVGWQGELDLTAGLAFDGAPHLAELGLGLRVTTPTEVEAPPGEARTRELAAGVGGRYLVPIGQLGAGVHGSGWLRRVAARGEADDGRTGAVVRYVPTVRLGPEIRWDLFPQASIRAAGSAEIALLRQEFTLDGEPALDLGRLRVGASVSFVATWR